MPLAHDVENYMLGRGILYFNRTNPTTGLEEGELDLGNCSNFGLILNTSVLEHYSSRSGLRTKDKEVVVQTSANGTFTLDEYSRENLVLAFFGTDGVVSQGAGSVSNASYTARSGRWIKLTHRNVSNVVVATYTVTTDYLVDADIGRLYIEPDGSIADGATITVSYDYDAVHYPTVSGFGATSVEGMLRFVGDPQAGPTYELEVWSCSLKPNGDINFLSEEWGNIVFNFAIDNDETNHPDDPYFRLIDVSTNTGTTTTTTTSV